MLVGQQLGFSVTAPFLKAVRTAQHAVFKTPHTGLPYNPARTPPPAPHWHGFRGGDDALGFSITSPFKKVAGVVAKTVTVPTKYAVKGTKVVAKGVYQAHAIPTKWLAIKPTMWLAEKATKPVKTRVQTVVNRRARKLAWDRRKSKTPTLAEHNEARTWTRNRLLMLSAVIPAAPLLVPFAGAPDDYQLGIAPAVVAAAVPVMMAAAAAVISQLNKPGDAPANPESGGGAPAPPPPPGADGGPPPAPGEVDLTPVQEAAEQGAEAMQQVAEQAAGKKRSKLPGGITKKQLMIGGAILGGVVLIAMLKPKG